MIVSIKSSLPGDIFYRNMELNNVEFYVIIENKCSKNFLDFVFLEMPTNHIQPWRVKVDIAEYIYWLQFIARDGKVIWRRI